MIHPTKYDANKDNPWDTKPIEFLIAELGNENGQVRQQARDAVMTKEHSAVVPLTDALKSENEHRRWEAAKALVELHDPATAPALVEALENEDIDVRWLAAEGLVALGIDGLIPLLRALQAHPDSVWLRESARHVMRALAKTSLSEIATPVLRALEGTESVLQVPIAAYEALNALSTKS